MLQIIADSEIKKKITFQNPWWDTGAIEPHFAAMKPRPYLEPFFKLLSTEVRRAIVLMGPRRIGKTVMLYHTIQRLIEGGADAKNIIYCSLDAPNFSGIPLEKMLEHALGDRLKRDLRGVHVIFDEIQYLKNWEVHLKTLVDSYRGIQFIASGSAAAALKLKSSESGAGRFTDFLLPPLTFFEFLTLGDKEKMADDKKPGFNIGELNKEFINYLNYGGFPEAIFSKEIQEDPARFIGSDIIDKVLLRDLPSLYGISDTQELNRFFTSLAYNTANEVSLDELSKNSGAAKQTIKKYLEYLEAAFLIKKLHRIDDTGKRFKREMGFKVHLTNPSMHTALFGKVAERDEKTGFLVETAIFSQTLHAHSGWDAYYARWKDGEVDMVFMENGRPSTCIEVKWSDSAVTNTSRLKGLLHFMEKTDLINSLVSTKTIFKAQKVDNKHVGFIPASLLAFNLGKTLIEAKSKFIFENLASL